MRLSLYCLHNDGLHVLPVLFTQLMTWRSPKSPSDGGSVPFKLKDPMSRRATDCRNGSLQVAAVIGDAVGQQVTPTLQWIMHRGNENGKGHLRPYNAHPINDAAEPA